MSNHNYFEFATVVYPVASVFLGPTIAAAVTVALGFVYPFLRPWLGL